MSSAANLFDNGDANSNSSSVAEPEQPFCDLCERHTMVLAESSSTEPPCPHCNHHFLDEKEQEEVQEPEQDPPTSTVKDFSPNSLTESSSSSAIIDPLSPGIVSASLRHFLSTQPELDWFNLYIIYIYIL